MQDCVQFVEIYKDKQLILEIVDRTRQQQTKEEKKRERERAIFEGSPRRPSAGSWLASTKILVVQFSFGGFKRCNFYTS
jgi:hypothetical protein